MRAAAWKADMQQGDSGENAATSEPKSWRIFWGQRKAPRQAGVASGLLSPIYGAAQGFTTFP